MAKRTISFLIIAAFGLTSGLLLNVSTNHVDAQPASSPGALLNHHQDVELSVLIGETKQVAIPRTDRPVFVIYSLSNVFDANTGNPEEPATGAFTFFYDSTSNLSPEDNNSESRPTGCNALVKVRLEGAVMVMETLNGTGPLCMDNTPAKLHVSFWY